MPYWTVVLEATSQWINAVFFRAKDADEMLSSRAHRQQWKLETWIDWWFGAGHCKEAFEWERAHYNVERFK